MGISLSSCYGDDVNAEDLSFLNPGMIFGSQFEYGKNKIKGFTEISFVQKGYKVNWNLGTRLRTRINYLELNTGVKYYLFKFLSVNSSAYLAYSFGGSFFYHFEPEGPECISGLLPVDLGIKTVDLGACIGMAFHITNNAAFEMKYGFSVLPMAVDSKIYNSCLQTTFSYSFSLAKEKH